MGKVDYKGKTVSDANIKEVLGRIAEKLETDVFVTSGDRSSMVKGSSKKSHHIQGRAADFYMKEHTLEVGFKKLQEKSKDIFDSDKKYQVIFHGGFTNTGGAHLHIGRFSAGSGVHFLVEGLNKDGKGKYTVPTAHVYHPRGETEHDRALVMGGRLSTESHC